MLLFICCTCVTVRCVLVFFLSAFSLLLYHSLCLLLFFSREDGDAQPEEFSYGDYVPLSLLKKIASLESTLASAPTITPDMTIFPELSDGHPTTLTHEQWIIHIIHNRLQDAMELSGDGHAVRAPVQNDTDADSDNDSDFDLHL